MCVCERERERVCVCVGERHSALPRNLSGRQRGAPRPNNLVTLGFRVWGLWVGVWGVGYRFQDLWCRVEGLGFGA